MTTVYAVAHPDGRTEEFDDPTAAEEAHSGSPGAQLRTFPREITVEAEFAVADADGDLVSERFGSAGPAGRLARQIGGRVVIVPKE